jgi:hypothetical protein
LIVAETFCVLRSITVTVSPKLLVTNAFMLPIFAGTTLLSPNADTARIAITAHRVRVRIVYLLFHLLGCKWADYTAETRAIPRTSSAGVSPAFFF